jgi:hypothetical protein
MDEDGIFIFIGKITDASIHCNAIFIGEKYACAGPASMLSPNNSIALLG